MFLMIAVLIGATLSGVIGALLAIPWRRSRSWYAMCGGNVTTELTKRQA